MATTTKKTTKTAAKRTTAKSTSSKPAKPTKTAKTTKAPPAATAAAKRAASKKTTAKSAAAPVKSATIVADKPVVAGPALRKSDFIDLVVTKSGLKKKDVKPAVEAAMAILGDAIEDGREVSFPELGKVKVNREKELAGAKVIICKLRRKKPKPATGAGPLAKAAE